MCIRDSKYTWTAFINGEEQDEAVIPTENEDDKWVYTDKGAVVEVYIDDYTLDVTVVEINYYLGEVSNVKTDDDDADYITVRALSEEPSLDDNTFYTTDFAEDDYVVFTVDFNEDEDFYICELMAPETVTGQVTRVQNEDNSENTYVRLSGDDGKYYYTALDTHMAVSYTHLDVYKRQLASRSEATSLSATMTSTWPLPRSASSMTSTCF